MHGYESATTGNYGIITSFMCKMTVVVTLQISHLKNTSGFFVFA